MAQALASAAEDQVYNNPEPWCCLSQFVGLDHKSAIEDLASRGFRLDSTRAFHDAERLRIQVGIASAITEAVEVLHINEQLTGEQVSALLGRHNAPRSVTPPVWTPPPNYDISVEAPPTRRPRAVRDISTRALPADINELFSRMEEINKELRGLAEAFKRLEDPGDTETT